MIHLEMGDKVVYCDMFNRYEGTVTGFLKGDRVALRDTADKEMIFIESVDYVLEHAHIERNGELLQRDSVER